MNRGGNRMDSRDGADKHSVSIRRPYQPPSALAFSLFAGALNTVLFLVAYAYLTHTPLPEAMTEDEILRQIESMDWLNLTSLILLWPTIAISVKRAHDRDRSGWFVLLFLVSVANLWPAIELAAL